LSQSPIAVNVAAGFAFILLAAVMNGAYAIPMRFLHRWKWENIWLLWTVLGLWIIPIALTFTTLPQPLEVYSQTPWQVLIRMGFMGLLWGLGVLLLGMSFPLIGVAVGAAVGLGCSAAFGALLPLLLYSSGGQRPPSSTIVLVLSGVTAVILGVGICGWAGRQRELQQGAYTPVQGQARRGLLLACLGGTLAASLNVALAAGGTIATAVAQQHASTQISSIAVWLPALLAGGVPGVLYTSVLLGKNLSAGLFGVKNTAWYWPVVVGMALLWLGSIVVYGVGVTDLGSLGVVIGWPMFMAGAVIASAAWGALFGEWSNSGRTAKISMAAGVLCLMAAMVILGKVHG
jgi:L-rhamnose-H+ transport protein